MESKTTITRQELYAMVWKESLTSISKRLNIPYTQLRKACFEMNVPIPRNGHWSKLNFGKPVTVIELSKDYTGANEVQISPIPEVERDPKVLFIAKNPEIERITNNSALSLKVPKKLFNPDKLIEEAQKSLTGSPHAWWNNRGMVRTTHGELDLRVSFASMNRALRFLDAFIKLLRAKGYDVVKVYPYAEAVIEDVKFEFNLREKNEQVTFRSWHNSEFKTTGLFSYKIGRYHGKVWNDGKTQIEDRLAEILVYLESEAIRIKQEKVKAAEERQVWEEKERIIREQQQRIEKEKSDFKDLYQQTKRWQRARFMREYLIAYEQNAKEKGGLSDEVQNWIGWARDKVDWYDPFVNKEDKLSGLYEKPFEDLIITKECQ